MLFSYPNATAWTSELAGAAKPRNGTDTENEPEHDKNMEEKAMTDERMEQIETTEAAENSAGATEPTSAVPSTQTSADSATQPAETPQPLSFDEMLTGNRDYRAEFDRRIAKALNTARTNWEEQQRADRDEAARLAGMNEAQRREYQLERERAALEADKAAFARQQLQVTVGTELQKRGLSAEFAPWLTGDDAESSQANINRFEAMWNASITAAVNTRMRADTPPRDPKKPAVDYSKMSDEEYYAAVMKRKE